LGFLAVWLSLWANLDSIGMIRGVLWQIHGHSVYPQYALAVLGIVAGMLVTWRFLVGDLWLGLSGNNGLFALSAVPYVLVPVFAIPALVVALRFNESVLDWIRDNLGQLMPVLMWLAAAAVVAKLWMAVFSWRDTPPERVRRYLSVWAGGTVCLIVAAVLFWDVLRVLLPSDSYRLRSLLVFIALIAMPLARVGLAPAFLSKNRHH
jgi:hypothetical protein